MQAQERRSQHEHGINDNKQGTEQVRTAHNKQQHISDTGMSKTEQKGEKNMMQGPLHKKWWCQSREIDKK
jgi:outer membrane receptor for monomeric catechols